MAEYDLIIKGAQVFASENDGKVTELTSADIGISGGKIVQIGHIPPQATARTIDAKGLTVIPGAIDSQVHFREPGLVHKEDISSGTRSAILGGVTTVFEMPNTKPPTLNAIDLADKCGRTAGRAWCNIAFYMGAGAQNVDKLPALENLPGCVGIKVFFGSSTGNLLLNDSKLIEQLLRTTKKLVAFHCEDENLLRERQHLIEGEGVPVLNHEKWRSAEVAFSATQKVVKMAESARRRVHILHVTSAQEMQFLKTKKQWASVEVTPQHLFLQAPDCYERLGTLAQMNPPIRDKHHQEALWKAVEDGTVDVCGSDHAPHTLTEKSAHYPATPSGMPGVQTILPMLLKFHKEGRLSMPRLIELLCANPARLFNVPGKGQIRTGFDADLAIVDLNKPMTITNGWSQSKCGWTPFDGVKIPATVAMTIVNGQIVMRDNEVLATPAGKLLFS